MAYNHSYISGLEFVPVFTLAVLDGFIPGEVQEREGCLLISLGSGIHFAAGSTEAGAGELLAGKLAEAEESNGRFTLFSGSAGWDQFLSKRFGERMIMHQRYSFQKFSPVPAPPPSSEASFLELDRQSAGNYPEFPAGYFTTYWGSVEQFLQFGFGIRVMIGERSAGECVSIFRSMEYAEMDIHIAKSARSQGVGAMLGAGFIEAALEKNLQPRWDCSAANKASMKLAEKLGFSAPAGYHIFTRQKQG